MALSQNDGSCGLIATWIIIYKFLIYNPVSFKKKLIIVFFFFLLPLQNLFMGSEKGEFLLLLLFWWRILPLSLK